MLHRPRRSRPSSGSKPASVYFRRIAHLRDLNELNAGRKVYRDRLITEGRWSYLTRATEKPPEGYVELGELCRVHRGQVTGANNVWIAGPHSRGLPDSVLYRTVTRAKELFAAEGILDDATKLRCVIDIPADLDELDSSERRAVDGFLRVARENGANTGYVASHRKAWWSVDPCANHFHLHGAARSAFVLNKADARHINIAHGLYPRDPMTEKARATLVSFLQTNISQRACRDLCPAALRNSSRAKWSGLSSLLPRCWRRGFDMIDPPLWSRTAWWIA